LLAQRFIQRMGYPTVPTLNLGGDGELVIFLWKAFAVLFNSFTDGNPAQYGRSNCETFDHGEFPLMKNKNPRQLLLTGNRLNNQV
jgi:hypothetical protein